MTHEASRRYLAVHLPLLSSERIKRERQPEAPFALVEKQRGAMRLVAVDVAAGGLGLEPGLTLADARARVPGLLVFDHDERADTALLEWLADACDRYTPMVATDAPHAIVLDITGCNFGPKGSKTSPESALAEDLYRRLAQLDLNPRLALASTPDAALALARHDCGDVRRLSVTALRIEPESHVALRRAGLRSIGDVARIAPAALAARFGERVPVLLARLLGQEDARITPRRAPAEIETEARFAEPIARTDDMLSTIAALIEKAVVQLSENGVGGRRFCAALFRSDGHVARLSVETATPTRDAAILDRLFRERIDALSDPLDPGFGYDMIRLSIDVTEPLAAEQLRLDGGKIADAEMTALLDRLSTRLGRNRVRRFSAIDTHVPEQAVLELPVAEPRALATWTAPEPGEPPLRPLHMFDPPHRIEVMAEVPDGPPRRFKWRRTMHEVARHEGPERIAAEWWTRADNAGLTRDYYRVEDVRGRRFWLFRHGLYGAEKAHPDWYLHGLFA